MTLLGMGVLLPSCGSIDSAKDSSVNESALYDPPTIHLLDGVPYKFKEGNLLGKGQRYHSNYSYLRAVTIGDGK